MTAGDAGVPGEVVIATRSEGKAAELRALLSSTRLRVVDLTDLAIDHAADEDAIECGETFEENALAKALYFSARVQDRAVIADDSGLCVAALGGAPGVRSRRYSGATGSERDVSRANSARLLDALRGVADRRAEFVCAVAYVANHRSIVCTGRSTGRILETPSGDRGFGYDPLFWSDEIGRSFGDVPEREKARVSHRARAVAALIDRLTAEPLTSVGQGPTLRGVRGVA